MGRKKLLELQSEQTKPENIHIYCDNFIRLFNTKNEMSRDVHLTSRATASIHSA